MRVLCALLISLSFQFANSQDLHFTLHQMTPLAFNPANTGAFYGSYRVSGLYRDQYRSVLGKAAFSTPTLSIDLPVIRGFKETDWVGVGLFLFSDKSGDIGLTQQSFKVSAAYHFSLNKEGSNIITLAYQTGAVQREIKNQDALVFESDLTGSMEEESYNMDKKGFTDHVGGLRFNSKLNKTDELTIGVAAGRFGRPDFNLIESSTYRLEPKIHVSAGLATLLSDKMKFLPNVSYQRIMKGSQSTLVLQGHLDYLFNEAKRIVLKGGVGYRSGAGFGDAIQLMFGADIKDFRLMFAYDVNVSPLAGASSGSGGFEIAAQYVGRIYKRPNPDPVIFCPRF